MPIRTSIKNHILLGALFLIVLVNITKAEKNTLTPARVLAKQTGATQFEEERFEAHIDCTDHKHHLKKRSSDEDVDYEVYQGVVGRPGIDFPIYPRIPKTSFSCRSFGNGYFADMETDCQVFHICEEGRKISFLCPNGTIFQQSELTCDWWFKVNCLGSPGYYAESAEILNKQRIQRVRPSVPVQGFNIVGGGLNIKPKINETPRERSRQNNPDRRIDSNEEPVLESVDFDDISAEKQLKGQQPNKHISNIDNNSNDNESQIAAESASFVGSSKRRANYSYEKPKNELEVKDVKTKSNNGVVRNAANAARRNAQRANNQNHNNQNHNNQNHNNNNNNNNNNNKDLSNESNERARGGQRGQQRFREDKKPYDSNRPSESGRDAKQNAGLPEKIIEPIVPMEVTARGSNGNSITAEPEVYESESARTVERSSTAAPSYVQGTYSTARRLDTSKTTPFYTPTVPPVSKSKSTEGKSFYIKGSAGATVTTSPSPQRSNNGAISNLFLETTTTKKAASSTTGDSYEFITSTFRPFVIGMRHNHEPSSSEVHRITLSSNSKFGIDLPAQKTNKKSIEYLPTTPAPSSTGPTYLPKSKSAPKHTDDAAGGDLLLFAPGLPSDESVTRNVNEMLKTMDLLKTKLSSQEESKYQGRAREGLEIPPSSGPDALISLAKYFATEQNGGSNNQLNNGDDVKPGNFKSGGSSTVQATARHAAAPALKLSDTTASITTAATPTIKVKADSIKDGLLSEKTVNQYVDLFGLKQGRGRSRNGTGAEGLLSQQNATDDSSSGLDISTSFPQIGTTDATIRELAAKPESRKIAQVFSNALNTYLEDPKTFREQLAAIRPTEPPALSDDKPNFTPVSVTDKGLFRQGTGATYLPTKPTPAARPTTTQGNIAAEINNKFDYSTIFPTTEVFDTTTYRPHHYKFDLSAIDLLAPTDDSNEGEEFLQREQTQSFVKSRNELAASRKAESKPYNEKKQESVRPTENPWNQISQTDFLDPLTINDGLMKGTRTTTVSPFTYLPKETTTPVTVSRNSGKLEVLAGEVTRIKSTQSEGPIGTGSGSGSDIGTSFGSTGRGLSYYGSAEVTTSRGIPNQQRSQETGDTWHDILNSYDLPLGTLPSSSGLQRIANKLFGGLNESEALHLKNVMQQAEHDRQVLSLLLLLIQTCDDHNGKALERSRKHLLNALIDMDGKVQHTSKTGKAGKATNFKSASVASSTARLPTVTPHRRGGNTIPVEASTTPAYTSTTELPASTTVAPTTSSWSTGSGSVEETTKFEIRVPDPEEDSAASPTTNSPAPANFNSNSDRRALELLKSLYSLASKFQSR